MSGAEIPVVLNVYDLSNGMARQFSPMVLGRTIDGIWHTGIVVFGREYYFGGGICADPPAATPYGMPVRVLQLGRTRYTRSEFEGFLASISHLFSLATYHVLDNNCNNFTDRCARFLLGENTGIPDYIINLPREAMESPMGAMLRPMLDQMQAAIQDQSMGRELALQMSMPMPNFAAVPRMDITSPPTLATPDAPAYFAITRCAAEPVVLNRANVAVVLAKLRHVDPQFKTTTEGADDDRNKIPPVSELLAAEERARPGDAFPVLDLLRVSAARDAADCRAAASAVPAILDRHVLSPDAPRPDCMMALRVAVNAFAFEDGQKEVMAAHAVHKVVEAAAVALEHNHASVVKTAAALAVNVAGASRRAPGSVAPLEEDHKIRLLFAAVELANKDTTPSMEGVQLPLLGCIGCLMHGDTEARDWTRTFGLNLDPYLDDTRCPNADARTVAREVRKLLGAFRPPEEH